MLNFLLVLGTMYVLHRWGLRELIRSRLAKSKFFDRISYTLFLLSGCTLTLYLSVLFVFPTLNGWSVWSLSLIPTVTGIILGDVFYARNLALTLRMLKQLRNKGEQTNE